MADQFCLKWNNYQLSLTSAFKHLLEEEDFVDVTLSAEGKSLKAHKVVLSACSTYFRSEPSAAQFLQPCRHLKSNFTFDFVDLCGNLRLFHITFPCAGIF